MEHISFAFMFSAFISGLLTFLAPCTLPLLPVYLTIIGGITAEQDRSKKENQKLRSKIFINGLMYVLGFSLIFILLGLFAGYIGSLFPGFKDWFRAIGGVIIIIFGLFLLGVIKSGFFNSTKRIVPKLNIKPGEPHGAFLLGLSMAFGWTPCVGPLLGSILTLAANGSTAVEGAILLMAFSLGLAVPFLSFALLAGAATPYVRKLSIYTEWIQKIGGVFLILIGLLLLFNRFNIFIQYGFQVFKFFEYEKILQYL